MNTIETKYAINDKVWLAHTDIHRKQHNCPDCLGEKEWKVSSPAGGKFMVNCPRCNANYQSYKDLDLYYNEYAPYAKQLTVGSVRTDSHDDRKVSYMCKETGVGSGSVYYEEDLYDTEEQALRAARLKADKQNSEVEWVKKQYDKSIRFADYELESAAMKSAKNYRIAAQVDIEMLFDNLRLAENIDEVKKIIDEFNFREQS